MPDNFVLTKAGTLATLTFNRPEKRNPLNEEVFLELELLLSRVHDDRDVRVLILTGTGNTFCAGADLSLAKGVTDPHERERIFSESAPRRTRLVERVLPLLRQLEPITIAAVNGYAVGGGWGLILGCDIRVAVEEAEFWFPEVDLGAPLSPTMMSMLIAHVGPAQAKEIAILGRHYTATELRSLGMINQIVKKDELAEVVYTLAHSIIEKRPYAAMVAKATLNTLTQKHSVVRSDLLLAREVGEP